METQPQVKQTKTKSQIKDVDILRHEYNIDRNIKISHAQLKRAPMVPDGLMGAETSINKTKVPGVEMYLQPNGMLWCSVFSKKHEQLMWFVIPHGNVLDYAVDKSVVIE